MHIKQDQWLVKKSYVSIWSLNYKIQKYKPDGNDVWEKKNKSEHISIPGTLESFEAHEHESQAYHSSKQHLQIQP